MLSNYNWDSRVTEQWLVPNEGMPFYSDLGSLQSSRSDTSF